ncbi:helix-turn-helix domain-containing protein [Halodesulfovibrio sp. MK-HDV]|jgi:AraC-like DNA-binding protein|uniref:helix-turn-helix domain-containing protein n=1 Tax=unclassified Halodesulfovibrio TaxID=2644657 RepID=UPI001371C904|nr:helix-turn-helix domain-containing protein [Halodesulfovibrio sp. MK-HDV]KAF1076624.1 Urease operon transcriptional activator [Halodesulfovibrio sp. MK-HDV]
MPIDTIAQKILQIIGSPPAEGHNSIFPLSTVYSTTQHTMRSVIAPQTIALLVLQGTKILTLQAESIRLHVGDMFMIPPQIEFTVENIPEADTGQYLALCLTFDEKMLARVGALKNNESNLSPQRASMFRFLMTSDLDAAIETVLNSIANYPQNHHLRSLYQEAVLTIIGEETSCVPYLWEQAQSWQARCAFLFSMDPGYRWTITEVAERLGVGERSLRRHLQAEDIGFRELLQATRLNAALNRLQLGTENVGEVAYRCGYESASRFAGLFKQRFGITPSELLRAYAVSEYSLTES